MPRTTRPDRPSYPKISPKSEPGVHLSPSEEGRKALRTQVVSQQTPANPSHN